MNQDDSLVAVVAHRLLNEITVLGGLVAQAREHLEPNTPDNQRADDLLQICEAKTLCVVENLRRYLSDTEEGQPPKPVIDLDRHATVDKELDASVVRPGADPPSS